MPLDNAHSAYQFSQPLVPEARGAEWAPRTYWQSSGGVDFSAPTAAAATAVAVFVNEGRWIAECPDCHGAQLACRTDKRFMCHCCGNVAVGGKWRPVTWPSTAGIEAALGVRPKANANWLPGESVAKLLSENVTHGLPVVPPIEDVKK